PPPEIVQTPGNAFTVLLTGPNTVIYSNTAVYQDRKRCVTSAIQRTSATSYSPVRYPFIFVFVRTFVLFSLSLQRWPALLLFLCLSLALLTLPTSSFVPSAVLHQAWLSRNERSS
ncbi:hypothetical protein FA13DRAFT_1730661, partial [Coprinellus micaceus]